MSSSPMIDQGDARYAVGQIVFVFVKERSRLLPARVVEEVVKRTIDGERVSYSIQFSTQEPNNGVVSIDSLKDEVFSAAGDARRVLTERTIASISRLVDVAVQKAGKLFPDNLDELTKPSIDPQVHDDGQFIELPDGRKAKIKVKK